MDKRFLAIIVLIIGGFLGVFWFSRDETPTNSVSASNHVQGAGNKKVALVEYGDFQCPACGGFYPIIKQVKARFGDDITFQFRHFPLAQIHPNAMAAHRAAEAAGLQGKFFEMHDLLYERQAIWTASQNVVQIFEGYAAELGLDTARFKQDAASETVNNTIGADIKEGQKAGASSTPTFVLNGKKLEENPRSVDDFAKLVQDEIAKQNQ